MSRFERTGLLAILAGIAWMVRSVADVLDVDSFSYTIGSLFVTIGILAMVYGYNFGGSKDDED